MQVQHATVAQEGQHTFWGPLEADAHAGVGNSNVIISPVSLFELPHILQRLVVWQEHLDQNLSRLQVHMSAQSKQQK